MTPDFSRAELNAGSIDWERSEVNAPTSKASASPNRPFLNNIHACAALASWMLMFNAARTKKPQNRSIARSV